MERGSKQPEFKLRPALDSLADAAACARPWCVLRQPSGQIEMRGSGGENATAEPERADKMTPALQMSRASARSQNSQYSHGLLVHFFLFKFRWRAAVGPATRAGD
jgi:hypothetical protein